MKVAMLDPSLFTGRYDDGLCAALAGKGAAVRLFGRPLRDTDAIRPAGYAYVPRFFRWGEAARRRFGEGRAFRIVKALEYGATCLMGSVDDLAADVVHMQWLPLAPADRHLIGRLGRRGALVHTVHNARAFHGDRNVQGRGYPDLLRTFDALIVHGEESLEALVAQGVARERLHIVPHPPMRLASDPEALAQVPPPARPRILFFGTIRHYKGLDLLIEACLSLWRAGHDFELAIAGKPFEPVEAMVAAVQAAGFADRLRLDLGFLPEPRLDAHMARADIIAFPYRHIDASGAFLSALHHGKPMVASDVGMFSRHGETVALFPTGDVGALAAALLSLLGSATKRRELGARARALGEALGSWEDAAVRTMDVYCRAMALAKARLA